MLVLQEILRLANANSTQEMEVHENSKIYTHFF